MEILIFSDSHGRADRMHEALERQLRRPDAVFFAGDGLRDLERLDFGRADVYAVCGNCDFFSASAAPTERCVQLADHKFFLTHGHLYGAKHGYGSLLRRAAELGADIVLFGHTHLPCCESLPAGTQLGEITLTRRLYLFNPGSIGEGRSFGTLTLRGETVLFSHGEL